MNDTTHLEITPKVIDLGSTVVQLSHVTRAGIWVQHPLRPAGAAFLLLAAGLFGHEFFLNGGKLTISATGSVSLWAACGAAALGIFMLAYARRSLLIATSDGGRLLLPAGDTQFATAFTQCVRDAIAAGPNAATRYEIDIPARSITPMLIEVAAHAPLGIPSEIEHNGAAGRTHSVGAGPVLAPTAAAQHGTNGTRSHAPLGAPVITRPAEQQQPARAASSNGATAYPTGRPNDLASRLAATPQSSSRPSARGEGLRDLAALMSFVSRSEIQHKKALLDLLHVVEDHEKGGAVTREEAEAHWRSFSDYVQQYLSNVDQLPDLTRRAGRGLGVPERVVRL